MSSTDSEAREVIDALGLKTCGAAHAGDPLPKPRGLTYSGLPRLPWCGARLRFSEDSMPKSLFAHLAILAAMQLAACFGPPPRPRVLPATKGETEASPEAGPDVSDLGDTDLAAAEGDLAEARDAESVLGSDGDDGGPTDAPVAPDAPGPNCAIAADRPPATIYHGDATCEPESSVRV